MAIKAYRASVGQHVMFTLVHKLRQLWPARPKLIGDMPPRFTGMQSVRLIERLTDGSCDNGMLTLRDMRQGIPHPMNAAALPAGVKNT